MKRNMIVAIKTIAVSSKHYSSANKHIGCLSLYVELQAKIGHLLKLTLSLKKLLYQIDAS